MLPKGARESVREGASEFLEIPQRGNGGTNRKGREDREGGQEDIDRGTH